MAGTTRGSGLAGQADAPVTLRLLTYNVRGVRAGTSTVAAVVAAAAPDVACFQEAPRGLRWRTRGSELARRSGLYVVTGGRPSAGNLLACSARVDVVWSGDHLLSPTRGLPRRGFTSALLEVAGARFGVVGAHLGLRSPERARHAGELATAVADLRERGASSVLLAGDLNSLPRAGEWDVLREALVDAADQVEGAAHDTFPARGPRSRIDVVWTGAGVRVLGCDVVGVGGDGPGADGTGGGEVERGGVQPGDLARASDHLPVLAVVELTRPGQARAV